MLDSLNNIIRAQQPELHGFILLVLLAVSLYLLWSPVGQVFSWLRLQKLINRTGFKRLNNSYLPDGMDGSLFIEHLMLQADGILLLTVKRYRGNIFAADNIEQWTQVVSNHSYKFPNPLYQLEADLQSLRAAFPKTNITGLVVFAGDCSFPKGKPGQVYNVQEFSAFARSQQQSTKPSEKLQQCWQDIVARAEKSELGKQSAIASQRDKKRLLLGTGIFMVMILYVSWLVLLTGIFHD
jgi:hypothetical protein